MKFLTIVLFVSASPALAQTATTQCRDYGASATCTTNVSPNPLDVYARALEQRRAAQARESAAQYQSEAEREADYQRRSDEQTSQVGKLIAANDCGGATRLAAFYGDNRLMDRVDEACKPAASRSSPSAPRP